MSVNRPGWAPPEVDPAKPSAARVYDYYLGGSHNFESDRAFGEQASAHFPGPRQVLRDNRAFLRRVVLYPIAEGIDQFLDLGSGIPTVGNRARGGPGGEPAGTGVVYVDHDPVAVASCADHGSAQFLPVGCKMDARSDLASVNLHVGHGSSGTGRNVGSVRLRAAWCLCS
jgi:hypothetical protein